MATLSSPGVGSGLDVASLVSQLMTVERRPLDLLAAQAQKTQARISAYGQLKGVLARFQSAMQGVTADRFSAVKATIGDASQATVSATSKAPAGTHTLEVTTLAAAQTLKSNAFGAASDSVGTGTLTFEYGTFDGTTFTSNAAKAAQQVTIGSAQGTLAGVRDAVNAANIGVTAALVDDGTGPRLVFSSRSTGTDCTLRVVVADDDGDNGDTAGLSRLSYDPQAAGGSGKNLAQASAAADATFVLDGIPIRRSSNTVADAMDGLTVTLTKPAPGSPTSLTIARDSAGMQAAVQSFVSAWNDVHGALASMTAYDAATKTAGPLQGDAIAFNVKAQLQRVLSGAADGADGRLTVLSQAGVTLQKDGSLAVDAAKLQAQIDAAPDGLAALFGAIAHAADARVTVLGTTDATARGAHTVNVSAPGTRGSLVGSGAAGLTVQAGVNDALTLSVDGTTASVKLDAGSYATADALAAQIQAKANGASPFATVGIAVDVAASAGVLTLTSRSYGKQSSVAASGTAADLLFGGGSASTSGTDIAGTIDGVAANGSGQNLLGATGSAAEGLRLRIAASAPGAFASVNVSRGYADLLARAAGAFLADGTGLEAGIDGLQAELDVNRKRQDEANTRLAATEARLRAQFTALDQLIASMNTTSTFLAQQLANLPKIGN